MAGWLLEGDRSFTGEELRLTEPIFPRGAPLRWRVPSTFAGDTLEFTGDGLPEPLRFPLELHGAGGGVTPALPPGRYAYRALVSGATGEVEVEAWAGSLLHPPQDLPGEEGRMGSRRPPRERPLRTHPLPWILALTLLSLEWIGRRRAGLR